MPNPNPLATTPKASQSTPALPQGLVDAARAYAKASRAPRTLEAYQADWRTFTTWCEAHGAGRGPTEGLQLEEQLVEDLGANF